MGPEEKTGNRTDPQVSQTFKIIVIEIFFFEMDDNRETFTKELYPKNKTRM